MNIDNKYRSMNQREMRDYIYDCHEEIYRLRHKMRCMKLSLLGAQRVCENQNMRNKVMDEWKRYTDLQKLQEGVITTSTAPAEPPMYVCAECGGLNGHLSRCTMA